MNDTIQPFVSIPTNDIQMFFVGIFQFTVCFMVTYFGLTRLLNFAKQPKIVKFSLIANILAWLLMMSIGMFFVPNEYQGSYLDVYANQTLVNSSFYLILAIVCTVLAISNFKIGIICCLFFGSIFGFIGGKGVGDFVSPKTIHAQISWLSFNDADKNLRSLAIGIEGGDAQQSASDKLAQKLEKNGFLIGVDFSDRDDITPTIKMDLVQAPYSDYLYLPEEYNFTQYGFLLFYSLIGLWFLVITSSFIIFFTGIKPDYDEFKKEMNEKKL